MYRIALIFIIAALLWSCGGGGGGGSEPTLFEVRIENISNTSSLPTSGGPAPVAFSPGIFVIHEGSKPIFANGEIARSNGLENLAEDGDPTALVESASLVGGVSLIGIVRTPAGQDGSGPIFPGQSYVAAVRANEGSSLSLALSFLQGNDLFVATPDSGIELYDGNGNPIASDVTSSFTLWDAGTEVNQKPGEGADQGLRQAAANTGAQESNPVHPVSDGFQYPSVSSILRVTVTPK